MNEGKNPSPPSLFIHGSWYLEVCEPVRHVGPVNMDCEPSGLVAVNRFSVSERNFLKSFDQVVTATSCGKEFHEAVY